MEPEDEPYPLLANRTFNSPSLGGALTQQVARRVFQTGLRDDPGVETDVETDVRSLGGQQLSDIVKDAAVQLITLKDKPKYNPEVTAHLANDDIAKALNAFMEELTTGERLALGQRLLASTAEATRRATS